MKVLINKKNPSIRITAPEVKKVVYPDGSYMYAAYIYSDEASEHFDPNDWTLFETETPTLKEKMEADKLFLDLNSVLVKFWKEKGRPEKGVKIAALERMLNWYREMGYVICDDLKKEED